MALNIEDFIDDAKYKARRVSISGMEAVDVEQELLTHLWLRRSSFDLRRASARTFANRLMDNKIRDLIRHAQAQKRYLDNNHLSLERLIEEGGDFESILTTTV